MIYEWPILNNDKKRRVLKNIPDDDIQIIKLLKEMFDSEVLLIDIGDDDKSLEADPRGT